MSKENADSLRRAYASLKHRIWARGAGGRIELEIESWGVWTFEDGLATRIEVYLDHEEAKARQAAGLPE